MRLTFEIAEKLRKQVLLKGRAVLEVSVISGRPEMGVEVRGSQLLTAVKGPRIFGTGEAGWQWKKREEAPTPKERATFLDIPDIANGDPVTWGHLLEIEGSESGG